MSNGPRAAIVAVVLGCSSGSPGDGPAPIPEPEVVVAAPDVGSAAPAPAPVPSAPPEVTPPEPEPADDGWQRGEVGEGDSLSRILARVNVPANVAVKVIDALATQSIDPAHIRVGARWGARSDPDGALAAFEYSPSELRTVTVTRTADAWTASDHTIATDVRTVELGATIDSSLWNAVTGAGGQPALVSMLVEVFASDVDFYTDTRAGDAFAVVVEQHEVDGAFVRYGRVLAAEYRGEEVGTVRGLWWTPQGREGAHFTPDGAALDRVMLKSPLKFVRVSSGFNAKRMHPVLHRVKGHFGVDYAAPEGTPVWAAADGKIVHRAAAGGAGNLVVLEHEGGMQTLYMHLSRFAKGQAVGDRVRQKTVIGYVGSTGLSTGAHLHFGVKRGGRFVDPATVKSISRPGIPAKQRAKFREETKDALTKLDALTSAE